MLELPGELVDMAGHARQGLNLVGNLRALVGDHHEIVPRCPARFRAAQDPEARKRTTGDEGRSMFSSLGMLLDESMVLVPGKEQDVKR